MTRDWLDWEHPNVGPHQRDVAAEALSAGWHPYYLAVDPEQGGGLTLHQLRSLQRHITNAIDQAKTVDWERWFSIAQQDSAAAAKGPTFVDFVAQQWIAHGRLKWGTQPFKPAHRISPRELLRLKDHARLDRAQVQWEVNDASVLQQLERASQSVSAGIDGSQELLSLCMNEARNEIQFRAWERVTEAAQDKVLEWICRFAEHALSDPASPVPVVAIILHRKQLTAVAVDAAGVCQQESSFTLAGLSDSSDAFAELFAKVGARTMVGPAEAIMAIRGVMPALADNVSDLSWTAIDSRGASWWAQHLHAVTTQGKWSAPAREALFLALRFQSPLETLAEVPSEEFAPAEFREWIAAPQWQRVEQRVDDVVHARGLDLQRAGPRAVARLCGISPLHAHRGERPEQGWESLEQFRQALQLNDRQWLQTTPFVRLGPAPVAAEPAKLPASSTAQTRPLARHGILRWDQLHDMQAAKNMSESAEGAAKASQPEVLHGVVLRAATFGAFLDIGAELEGMLHISELSPRFVADPWELLAPGDVIEVEISSLDETKRRIALRRLGVNSASSPHASSSRSSRSSRKSRTGSRTKQGARSGTGSKKSTPSRGSRRSTTSSTKSGAKKPPRQRASGRPQKPPEPLSQEMADGKAPMRSFSDLVQFYDQKRSEDESS